MWQATSALRGHGPPVALRPRSPRGARWSYFDWVAFVAQARLAEATGAERAVFARDLYSYLHLPMVVGIVLFALGLKTTLAHVSDSLPTIPALGLCGGVALYLLAHVALRLRIGGGLGRGRPVATILLLGLLPLAREVPSLARSGWSRPYARP
jgi:low temperature requirement protein LtrA